MTADSLRWASARRLPPKRGTASTAVAARLTRTARGWRCSEVALDCVLLFTPSVRTFCSHLQATFLQPDGTLYYYNRADSSGASHIHISRQNQPSPLRVTDRSIVAECRYSPVPWAHRGLGRRALAHRLADAAPGAVHP